MSDVIIHSARRAALAVGGLLLFAPAPLPAQPAPAASPASPAPQLDSPAPPRIGNIWDNLPHQPTQADVGAAEQELGLSGTPEHDRAVDRELQDLGNQLLNDEQNDRAVNGRRP